MRRLFSVLILVVLSAGCRDVGIRELDLSARNRASVQTARDVMNQLQAGLKQYYQEKRHYPATTEAHLYDSLRNYMNPQIDPVHLYRNDNGKGYFIAVGGRANKIVYRYPSTVGAGDYTLYWVGVNGVDEDDEGDDLDAWEKQEQSKQYERRRIAELIPNGEDERMLLVTSGMDPYRDSVRFEVRGRDSILYSESWPMDAYFRLRPELTDGDRRRIVHFELERFFNGNAFVHTDSLLQQPWSHWVEVKPNSPEMSELVHSNEQMFNFYMGDRGSRGIAWLPSKKKFVVVWKS